jgi:hypothetical protein
VTYFNSLRNSGNYIYHLLQNSVTAFCEQRVYLWVAYDFEISSSYFPKQRKLPELCNGDGMFSVR